MVMTRMIIALSNKVRDVVTSLHAKEVARENFSKLRKLLAWGEAVITTFQVSITELKHKYSLHFQAKIMT